LVDYEAGGEKELRREKVENGKRKERKKITQRRRDAEEAQKRLGRLGEHREGSRCYGRVEEMKG
jgi:hypothetical protein